MDTPVTELDSRFSDPGATPAEWENTRKALADAQIFWICTVRADGRPHATPLVAVYLDGAVYFSTGAAEQKALNLQRNPHVILMTGCNQWDAGLDIMVEGEAMQLTDEAMLERLAAAWATKWDGRWQFEVRDGRFHHAAGEALVFSVTPKKILAFGKGAFSHTRHRF